MSTQSWWSAVRAFREPRVAAMAGLGFSAGLPFLLVFSTLTAWLTEAGVSRTAIGFFAWVGITYSIKVVWAPVIDRVNVPWLGRRLGPRRGWMLVAQLGIAAGLLALAHLDPAQSLHWVALVAVLVAFASATQDIVIDAWRIEAVDTELQGVMAASYIFGYRVALLVAGAGALYLAALWSWPVAYATMAALLGVGLVTVLLIAEPTRTAPPAIDRAVQEFADRTARHLALPAPIRSAVRGFVTAVVSPLVEFFARNGARALLILAFVGVYRMGDLTMGIMANPFYLDLGFSKIEIAEVTKVFGFFMTIAGSILGGILVVRFGLMRPLLLGALLVAATNLLFAWLALIGPDLGLLTLVVSADSVSGGLANAVFVAYLSSLTNRAYTATQYALFSSLMTLPGKFLSGWSGAVVDALGYPWFFVYAAATGLPALLLVLVLMRVLNVDTRGRAS